MKIRFLLIFMILFIATSCSPDDENVLPESELSEYEKDVIKYFKEIALGFESGNASEITRKWNTEVKVFIGGQPNSELLAEFEKIRSEINLLATDGFKAIVVNDSLESNYYIFLGSGAEYGKMFPNESDYVSSNWGLFNVRWNGQNQIYSGHMYVDIMRANLKEQKHLLREEFTQSLGLGQDSPWYPASIFQINWTSTTEYAPIDRDLISLLYHPEMSIGLYESQVDKVLRDILISE